MIRGALDVRSAFPALVIVDDEGAGGRRALFAGTMELGSLVEGPSRHGDKRREISADAIAQAVEKVSDACALIERLVIGDYSDRTETFVEAVRARLTSDGIAVEHVDVVWSKLKYAQIVRHLNAWPQENVSSDRADGWRVGDYAGTRAAAQLLLTDLGIIEGRVKGANVRTLKQEPSNGASSTNCAAAPSAQRIRRILSGHAKACQEDRGESGIWAYARTTKSKACSRRVVAQSIRRAIAKSEVPKGRPT